MSLLESKSRHIIFSDKERFNYGVIDKITEDTATAYKAFKETVKQVEVDTIPLFDSSFNSLVGLMQSTRFRDMLYMLQEAGDTVLSDTRHVFLTSNFIPAWIQPSSVKYSPHFCGFTSSTSGFVPEKETLKYVSTNADVDDSGYLYKVSSDEDLSVTYSTSSYNGIVVVPHANNGTQLEGFFHSGEYDKALGGHPLIPGLVNYILTPDLFPYFDIVCYGTDATEQTLYIESVVLSRFRATETTWSFTAEMEGDWELIAGTYPFKEFSVIFTRDNKSYTAVSTDFIARFYAKVGDIIKIKIPANTVVNFLGYNVWYPLP